MKTAGCLLTKPLISGALLPLVVVFGLALTSPLGAQDGDDAIREPGPGVELLYHTWGFDGPPKFSGLGGALDLRRIRRSR